MALNGKKVAEIQSEKNEHECLQTVHVSRIINEKLERFCEMRRIALHRPKIANISKIILHPTANLCVCMLLLYYVYVLCTH